jgi:hypothetical protein
MKSPLVTPSLGRERRRFSIVSPEWSSPIKCHEKAPGPSFSGRVRKNTGIIEDEGKMNGVLPMRESWLFSLREVLRLVRIAAASPSPREMTSCDVYWHFSPWEQSY